MLMKMPRWAILVVDAAGGQAYLRNGHDERGPVAVFLNRARAEAQAAWWREGLGEEAQAVTVVPYPRDAPARLD
jgi:hypothetical protein